MKITLFISIELVLLMINIYTSNKLDPIFETWFLRKDWGDIIAGHISINTTFCIIEEIFNAKLSNKLNFKT